ncbi:MAG: hypothetical protein ALECFALPRED_004970 [Alectoria fallacina]|uniref:Uncharacterized protein n=1 Tax=Alectoria fallacina TaxID=1903189 RepID=A0A8H3FWF8_9LECA|nr:MAG: hypothetical protein ALECFALPRED_004970 [Alectoria fallacina]
MDTSGMGTFGLGPVGGIDFTKTALASMVAREKLDRVLSLPQWTPSMLYDAAPVKPDQWQRPMRFWNMTPSWFLERKYPAGIEIKKVALCNTGASTWEFMNTVKDSLYLMSFVQDPGAETLRMGHGRCD